MSMRNPPVVRFFGVLLWIALTAMTTPASAATPSFDCKRKLNDAEKIICDDDTLATLDRKLGEIFIRAMQSLPRDKTAVYFVAEQQAWVNDRDGCPTTHNPLSCLSSVYRTRIAELQGRFHMVSSRGPFRFVCDGSPPWEIVVTWYDTDPPSGILESASGEIPIFAAASGSATHYIGDGVAFTDHQGTATVAWGTESRERTCTLKK